MEDKLIAERYLKYLEDQGRKKVLIDFTGTIIANRWYVRYLEDDEDSRPEARGWNAYIHQNLQRETPDGPDSHHHAWETWSLILSGGYWEEVNGVLRFNAPGTIAHLHQTDFHRIVKTNPNCWTLFVHGPRTGKWGFRAKPCEKVCETCMSKYGACFNSVSETPYEIHFGSKGKWRTVQWFNSKDPKLPAMLARRRKAIKRVNVLSREEVNRRAALLHLGKEDAAHRP